MKLNNFNRQIDDIGARWPWLLDHMERVGMFVYALGREYEVSRDDLERLYMAGFLHGLGEYGVRVFQRCAEADEQAVRRAAAAWPVVASSMILMVPGFEYVARVVGQCGENFDGSGEPFGARCMQIHVFAAMIRVADIYDTCRLDGASHDAAAAELRRLSDVAVPKRLITPFLKNIVSNEDLRFDYAELRQRRAEAEQALDEQYTSTQARLDEMEREREQMIIRTR